LMLPRHLLSTLFPYTTLFRSFAAIRVQFDKIHQRQIAAESGSCRITADSFVVGNEITAAVENEATIEDFNWFHVVRRVSMDKCKDRKSTRLNSSHVSISYAVF